MYITQNLSLFLAGILIAASTDWAAGGLPALPQPPKSVTQAERERDIKVFRDWWYPCSTPPDVEAVIRIKAWSDTHPEDGEAMFFVWASYRFGLAHDLIEHKDVKPVDLAAIIKRSAALGYVPARARYAMILVGSRLVEDSGEAPDIAAGLKMLEDCIEKGDPDAYFFKGGLLVGGEAGLKRDMPGAERYLDKAIHLGCIRALAFLGDIQVNTIDEETGLATIRKGAEAGDPYAQLLVAKYSFRRARTRKELAESFQWLKKSAEGQKVLSEAHAMLADCYFRGKGTDVDHVKAFSSYKVATSLGDQRAALELAKLWLNGDGCTMDIKSGVQVLNKLTELDYGPAETLLGVLYLEGLLVPRDPMKAKQLFQAASRHDDAQADAYLRLLEAEKPQIN